MYTKTFKWICVNNMTRESILHRNQFTYKIVLSNVNATLPTLNYLNSDHVC